VTRLLYREDPYLLEFEARVVERRTHEGRPAVVLDQTAFYAESGGQPWDTGLLGGVPVVAVVHHHDAVVHVLQRPLEGDQVRGRVDESRRRDHRQQHHGQHLLSRALLDGAGAPTTSFHLGETVSTIDVAAELKAEAVRNAERRANDIVWAGRPVTVRTVSRAEAEALGVHAPEEAGDSVRIVEAEGFDRQPCGGTHPRNTSEVGVVVVLGHERHKGGTRIRFVCGDRAVAAFHQRQALVDETSALLSSAPEALPEAARRLRDAAAEADRRCRGLLERALEAEAARLVASGPSLDPLIVVASFDGYAPADLRTLAGHVVAQRSAIALLGSRHEGRAHLVFARSPGRTEDVVALLQGALAILGGRGGGRGDLAQGGGDVVERLDEALAAAAAAAADPEAARG
jgi:alanyl-tRNA synthetase